VQSPFCIGSSVENSGAKADRNPAAFAASTLGPPARPRIIDTLHLYPGMVKPKRITISLVVNSSNHGTPEDPHTMNRNIGRCRMGEHDAGLSLFAKINGRWNAPGASTTRSARICQTRMRARLAGAEFPRWIASPLNGDDIILVVQANCSAPA
jgi:hypothetical protein